ncbi:hypothetical protein AB834_05170 [PVC group bacterium (ex Bugula neritina AB1)]|nr:hypothetical protein AB834_05170 [PVC group bacterium (ex Bugula neritina AB1)]
MKRQENFEQLEEKINFLENKVSKLELVLQSSFDVLRHHVSLLAKGEPADVESIQKGLPYKEVFSKDLDDYLLQYPDSCVLDVRTDEEWSLGHIEGAIHVEVSQLENTWDKLSIPYDKKILVVCARGVRSAWACHLLFSLGYKNTVNIEGGMMDYPGEVLR